MAGSSGRRSVRDDVRDAAGWGARARTRAPALRLLMFRLACGGAALVAVYVGAALGQARHAGLVAASAGLVAAMAAAGAPRTAPEGFLRCAPTSSSSAPARAAVFLPAAGLLLALALAPLLLAKLPPFGDYANHLARMYVIAQHGADPLLDRFYAIRWHVLPNLGADLVIPPLAEVTGIFVAGKLFIVLYTVLLLAGPHAVHLALYRRLSFGPLAGVLFVYGAPAKWGLLNYELGVGLALFATAAWIVVRGVHPVPAALVSVVCVPVLLLCHLMAVALYGLAIVSVELWLNCASRTPPRVHLLRMLLLPFAAVIPVILPWDDRAAPATPWRWGGIHARLDALRFLLEAYFPDADLLAGVLMAAGFVWAAARHVIRLPAVGWMFLGLSGAVFLATPDQGMGGWGAAARLPMAILFMLLGMCDWDLRSWRMQRGFLIFVTALLVLRLAGGAVAFRDHDRVRADLERSLQLVAPGSRILVAADYAGETPEFASLRHLPALAMIERSSLVSLAFSNPGQQVLVVRPPFRAIAGGFNDAPVPLPLLLAPPAHLAPGELPDIAPSGRIYWANWERTYDYVYLLDRAHLPNPAPDRLDLLYDGTRFQLFRVKRPGLPPPA